MVKIILIGGKAGAGKDTFGNFLAEDLRDKNYKVLVTHFGDLLKYICKSFFEWDGQKNEAGRKLLQYIGTDVIREQDQLFWVNFLAQLFSIFPKQWDYIIIPDLRFPNEATILKDDPNFEITTIEIYRDWSEWESPLTEEANKHISENALSDFKYNYRIKNEYMQCLKCLASKFVKLLANEPFNECIIQKLKSNTVED